MQFRHDQAVARFLMVMVLGLSVGACADQADQNTITQDIPFTPEGIADLYGPDSTLVARLVIELAETAEEQAQGLMYRRSLPERGGMLFIDQNPKMQEFWMRNTPLPLDILFLDEAGRVINIVKRTKPYSDDRIKSTAPAAYTLEVRAGVTDRYGIDSTYYMSWERRTFD